MRRAAALVGGVEPLATYLNATTPDVLKWISGSCAPDEHSLARASFIVAATDTQRLSLRDLIRERQTSNR